MTGSEKFGLMMFILGVAIFARLAGGIDTALGMIVTFVGMAFFLYEPAPSPTEEDK